MTKMQNKLSGSSPAAPTTIYGKLTVHQGIQFPLLSVGDRWLSGVEAETSSLATESGNEASEIY